MRSLFALFAFSLMLLPGVVLRADVVNFNIDPNNSTVSVAFNVDGGDAQSTPTYGTLTVDLTNLNEPFGTAQITQLNAVLQNSLSYSLLGGGVQISTRDDDAMWDLLTPGPGGNVDGLGQFDQLGNEMGLSGTVDVLDFTGLFGSGPFDLGSLAPAPVDFQSVNVSKSGQTYTLTADFEYIQTINELGGVEVTVSGSISATGFAAVPEPTSAFVSLGLLGAVAMQRRRRVIA